MKRSYRRALFFVALLVFMAITPVVILYALGYRTSFTAADPVPVGVLLIESEPSRATVYADEKEVGQTPHALSNIRAGSVTIRIEKEGYKAWQKNVQISPGRATEIRDIRLFPAALEPRPLTNNVRLFSVSPNRRLLAVVHTNNTLTIYDQVGEVVSPPQPLRANVETILWSPNSDAVLLNMSSTPSFWYVSVAQKQLPSALPILAGAHSVVWDPRIPGRLLYLDASNTLKAYNVASRAQAPLIENIDSFATSANHIYAVGSETKKIGIYTLQGQASGDPLSIPEGDITQMLVTPQGNIALLTNGGEVSVLADKNTFIPVAKGMQKIAWSPSGQVLLLATDTSLHVYNVNDKRTTLPLHKLILVQRLSRPIASPQWFAGSRHLLYQIDDEMWIVETDTRDYPVAYQVDTTNLGAAQATVGEEGEVLFYLKRGDSGTQLVAAPLLVP